jgi:hypothetical protein
VKNYQINDWLAQSEERRRSAGLMSADFFANNTGTIPVQTGAEMLLMHMCLGESMQSSQGMPATSAATVVFVRMIPKERKDISGVVSPAQMLEAIMAQFDLSVSDTAQICRVSRQTVYQWMDYLDIAEIRSNANRQRLCELFQVAQRWRERPPLTGNFVTATLTDGSSLKALLADDVLDMDRIVSTYATLAASSAIRRRDEHEKVVTAVPRLKEGFRALAKQEARRKGKA